MDMPFCMVMRRYWKSIAGFALFLACLYLALFSCSVVTTAPFVGGLEYVWVSSAVGQLCCGLLTVLVATRIQQAANPTAYILGVLAFILGEFIVWYGYYDNSVFFLCAYAGGCIVGVGLGLMALSWGKLYSAIPFLPAETLIITAFLGAFVLYALILAFKLSGFVSLIFLVIFAICSIACFTAALKDCPSENTAAGAPVSVKTQLASFWQVFLIQTLLWMLFAFFRVISTPNTPGDRVLHFLIPFSVSAIIATAMLLLIRTFTRNFNISSAFRVGLPLYFFSCALLFFAPEHQTMRIIAYTINFVGMFIVQLTYWISILKFTGRKFLSPTIGFGFFITAEGLGILIGCGLGLVVKPCYTCGTLISIAILLGSIATTGIMAVVYSPRVAAGTAKTFASSADAAPGETISDASAPATEAQAQEILASLARERAHALTQRYALTSREEEIAGMLLQGYSRADIRDELVVSLHTVHAHVHNLYVKCDVHSLEELTELASRITRERANQ